MTAQDVIPEHLRTTTVVSLLHSMLASRDFGPMPLLLDAMQDAGGRGEELAGVLHLWVCAEPGSDGPRLRYAEAVGGERGEFVRVQCELARPHPCKMPDRCIFGPKRLPFGPMQTKPFCGVQACRDLMWPRERLFNREKSLFVGTNICKWFDERLAVYQLPHEDDLHYDRLASAVVSRGFISALTCSWSDWLAHHAVLYWHPEQVEECPSGICHCGESCDSHNWGSGHSPVDMPDRIPRPFPATAQPLETVRLTDARGREAVNWEAEWIVMPAPDGDGARFDRVTTCPACGHGMHLSDACEECDCGTGPDRYNARWTCPAWPRLRFEMPMEQAEPERTFEERYEDQRDALIREVAARHGIPASVFRGYPWER